MEEQKTPLAAPPDEIEAALPPPSRLRRKKSPLFPTWLVAVTMLFIGIAIGFFGRPFVVPAPAPTAGGASGLAQSLVSQVRHFKGNANAPITIIEFSDFQ